MTRLTRDWPPQRPVGHGETPCSGLLRRRSGSEADRLIGNDDPNRRRLGLHLAAPGSYNVQVWVEKRETQL